MTDRNIDTKSEIADVFTFQDVFATPFDALKTAEQNIQFAIDPSKGLTRRRYHWHSNNTFFDDSLLANNDANGTISVTTTATGSDTARLSSAVAGQYVSQSLAQPGIGLSIADSNVSRTNGLSSISHGTIAAGAGWHDGTSGGWGVGGPVQTFLGIRFDSSGASAVLVSAGTHMANSPVGQADWNLDTLDGSDDADNPSGLTLKPEGGYIYNMPYTWYAFGALFVGIIHPGENKPIMVHQFELDQASFDRPNLPTLVVVDNGGSASALDCELGGMQYSLYGEDVSEGGGEERGIETSRLTSSSYIANQVVTNDNAIDPNAEVGKPLLALKRVSGDRDLRLRADSLIPEPENDIYVYAWDEYDPGSALDGTFREPHEVRHSTETKAEVNTSCTTYTPTTAVMRGWDKATVDKQNEATQVSLNTDDEIPTDATRVYTAVHDGTSTDAEVQFRAIEGF